MIQLPYQVFRAIADVALVLSAPVLLVKIRTGHDGISLATQILRLFVFFTRYLDFLTGDHVSFYVDLMKALVLAGSAVATVSLIYSQRKHKWEGCIPGARVRRQVIWLSLPCVVLAIFFNSSVSPLNASSANERSKRFNLVGIAQSFSIFLSTVADLPQLRELRRAEKKSPLVVTYCLLLFAYRLFYIPSWHLQYVNEGALTPLITGLVQTMLFLIHTVAIVVDARRRKATPAIQLPTDDGTPGFQDEKEKSAFV